MFEERLARMEDRGEGDWGDKPVRRSISFGVSALLIGECTERHAHVAHERGPRARKVS